MTADALIHRKTWDQIPWIVNGTLPEPEMQTAAQHLQGCGDCREELEFQRRIALSLGGGELAGVDPQRGWQVLHARIEAAAAPAAPVVMPLQAASGVHLTTALPAAHPRWTGWLVAAMVVQSIGLGVLGTALWSRSGGLAGQPAVYRTLSAAEPLLAAAPTIRVVFAGDVSIGRMQALLNQAGLQVLSGPSTAGVWSLGPAGDSSQAVTQAALQQLRGSPDVHFAEAVGGSP